MNTNELIEEIRATEDIIEVRKRRFKKEINDLKRDRKKLKKLLESRVKAEADEEHIVIEEEECASTEV